MSYQQDAVRQWAYASGAERADQAWLLSDFDTWEKNPHYVGPPAPHPEDYNIEENYQPEPRRQLTAEEQAFYDKLDNECPF